ncbi:FmdE family protein [Zhenpiania hominis]|uniref:FmdE family protein n=1 Tax=Zhenpiania hominis TaxID=2763644 RepID=UPI0039F5E87D
MSDTLWKKAVSFHGHECGGIALGVRACMEAIDRLGITFSEDEDLVCVTENDACGVDAVQAILGCTLGKGNLIYYGTGKMAFNFYNRTTGESFRLIAKPKKPGGRKGKDYIEFVLNGPLEEIFDVTETRYELPERARSLETIICEVCGEGAPETKIRIQEGKKVCLECFHDYSRGW